MTSSTRSDTFYRYTAFCSGGGRDDDGYQTFRHVTICEETFEVLKRTRCGVWIAPPGYGDKNSVRAFGDRPRFVNLSAKKRYACETRALALESFLARKRRQRRILLSQVRDVDLAIAEAKNMLKKEVAAPPRCPNDTDGDGDCGRPACPVCGERSYPHLHGKETLNADQKR